MPKAIYTDIHTYIHTYIHTHEHTNKYIYIFTCTEDAKGNCVVAGVAEVNCIYLCIHLQAHIYNICMHIYIGMQVDAKGNRVVAGVAEEKCIYICIHMCIHMYIQI